MSTDYDQQPDQHDQGYNSDEGFQDGTPDTKSSGLIRAGIFGVILFLAVIGLASVINNWFRDSSGADEKLAQISDEIEADSSASPYQKLEQSWIETRALLETELENKRRLLAETADLDVQIEDAKQDVVRAENAVALSLEAVEQGQASVDVASEKISDLEDNTPERAFEKAQLAATNATENADAAQAEFERAKLEQKRIESTVAELRRAAKAAQAAANASRVVVAAAESAKQAVADNQDVMADADGPALSNLESNFFADAEQQAVNMEKSAKAASQAVEISELYQRPN